MRASLPWSSSRGWARRFPARTGATSSTCGSQAQAGDVSPRRDEYMFSRGLLCARDRLYLSYVSRHELTGDSLEPAPVVAELLRVVERWYLPEREEGAPSPLVETHALRRYEPRYFPALHGQPGPEMPASPAARRSRRARLPRANRAALARASRSDLGRFGALSKAGAAAPTGSSASLERPAGGSCCPRR